MEKFNNLCGVRIRVREVFSGLMLCILVGCASGGVVKEPGDSEINAEAAKAYREFKAKSKISRNEKWNAMVQRVANRIAKASGENFQWEYVLIENPEVNAWCMPGGKIAVYTGIMPVLKTEGALAAVLGHEVAHATRRHGKQQYARSMNTNLLGLIVGGAIAVGGEVLCESRECKMITGIGGAAAGLAATFFTLKFSRTDESDADLYGQQYMARAGYDPSESIQLWQRMGAAHSGEAPPEILSTHPSDETRQEKLRATLPAAEKMYSSAAEKYGIGEAIR
ncbi:MAG: M48 family metallopeptidase [Deltaproteobacteria bacterium]